MRLFDEQEKMMFSKSYHNKSTLVTHPFTEEGSEVSQGHGGM